MIVFDNGVRVFINTSTNKDIYVGISGFGFEKDIGGILGTAHLLEHILISFDVSRFIANASTARSYMSFWCTSIRGRSTPVDAIRTLISWFFDRDGLKHYFPVSKIKYHIKELENEYYFRNEVFHCMDALTFLANGDLYNGGRLSMLDRLDDMPLILQDRMCAITGPNIVIFVRELNDVVLSLLVSTFGTLPSCPLTIPCTLPTPIGGKIIMMPSPFYTVMVRVQPSLYNILSILCLYEIYHLVDYETVNNKLYVTISFIHEHEYESFLHGSARLNFTIYKKIRLHYGDDFLMNMYLSFPCIRHDIFDYLTIINTNVSTMIPSLEQNIYQSIKTGDYIVVYPNFSNTMSNVADRQLHKTVVIDTNIVYVTKPTTVIDLMKKHTHNDMYIKYSDTEFIDYVQLALGLRRKIHKNVNGIHIRHQFSADDIKTILESETFMKYSKSKPAAMYQYLILSFFVSGNTIEDILQHRESVIKLCRTYKNKILLGKQTRYDIQTLSSFVCGIFKGPSITSEYLTDIMWKLKRKGLIYSLEFVELQKNMFYLFMFTIYPEDVTSYLTSRKLFTSRCVVVSKKCNVEDFSSMKKDIIIKLR
ncbi:gp045L [Rabbit fibroma virus]|uniref:Probable metalloendopeptidase G1-type n=1 Tax=Rabbit fibroma virus (strain Kasza) TaxID=10272 RepID=PG085_RFVKA|nr:putative metalloprotease [Rabbit fibroma virus]Q9Q926.1 RecName: Full=Probable metalloendopeptidase G1-type [Rabbit fibroma virus (strain Kasza)]AAF17927.1 gp045L [Rabbit fibroma virus]